MNSDDIIETFKKIESTHDQLTRLSQHESVKKFFFLLGNKKFNDYFWDGLITKFEMNSEFWDAKLDPQVLNKLVTGNKLFNNVDPQNIDTQRKFSQFLFNLMMKDIGFIASVTRMNNVTNLATTFSMLVHSIGLDIEEAAMNVIVDSLTQLASDITTDYEKYSSSNESKKRKNDDSNNSDDSNKPKRPNNDDKH